MKYKLLNFDHGNKYPEIFNIGPFKIEINDQHCQNLLLLPRNESITFGHDKNFNRVVKKTPKKRGGWIETATIEIDEKNLEPSVISPETVSKSNVDDLCLLLSFLTGRFVSLENNPFIEQFSPEEHTDKVVHYGYFSRNKFPWQCLPKLREEGLAGQFYNLIVACQSRDFVGRAVHYNNALNVAYDKWFKNHCTQFINNKTRSKIKDCVNVCLEEQGIKEEIKQEILSRVNNICNHSAIFKLKQFLRGIELYPEYEFAEMHERLRWLNYIRNSMAHTGMLPSNSKVSNDLISDVTSSIISLVLRINQYYFGRKVLGLDDPYLDYIKNMITPYFLEGKFLGRLIFKEGYKEYMERAKEKWVAINN